MEQTEEAKQEVSVLRKKLSEYLLLLAGVNYQAVVDAYAAVTADIEGIRIWQAAMEKIMWFEYSQRYCYYRKRLTETQKNQQLSPTTQVDDQKVGQNSFLSS